MRSWVDNNSCVDNGDVLHKKISDNGLYRYLAYVTRVHWQRGGR